MISSSFAFLFLVQLGLLLAMLIAWWRIKDRMASIELRASESLDDQDLVEFQDRIASLLVQVREAGQEVVQEIDRRRESLEREGSRAKDAEKRLVEKIKSFERVEEKARKRLGEWATAQSKRSTQSDKKKPEKKVQPKTAVEKPEIVSPSDVAEAGDERPLKVSYLKRDFRSPEPQAPVAPTANRYLKVYAMADAGNSREEIAKACGYLPGEVDLILNLRPRSRG